MIIADRLLDIQYILVILRGVKFIRINFTPLKITRMYWISSSLSAIIIWVTCYTMIPVCLQLLQNNYIHLWIKLLVEHQFSNPDLWIWI